MSDASFNELDLEVERYELHEPLGPLKPDRRLFVKAAGTGLMLAVSLNGQDSAYAQRRSARRNEFLSERFLLGADGSITVFTSKVEVGQGSRTQLTQAVAEELGIGLEHIELVMADTKLCPNDGGTAGSRTTPSTVPRVRNAAAAIRRLLTNHAASHLGRPVEDVNFGDGVFRSGDKSVTLGELATDPNLKARLKETSPSSDEQLTVVEDWETLGTSVEKVDGRAVVTGEHRYPSDIQRPGMLYGKVLRPAAQGAELESIDINVASTVDGAIACRDGDFIGCVAETSYEASLAVDALASTAKWKQSEQVSSDQLFDHFKATASQGNSSQSDPDQGPAAGNLQLDVAYTIDYIQHAPMEPRAAVAEWTDGNLTVWTGTQQPDRVHGELVRAFGLPPEQVRVIVPDTGGGFGGKHTGEVAVEAARLAKTAERPVHLRWTREEEFTWAYFRPAGLIDVKASLDEKHRISFWDFTNYNSGGSAIDSPYRIPNAESRFVRTDYPLRQGSYRALASTANTFARESAMDELASLAGEDPLAFRLRHLDDGRLKDVLVAAARKFSWEQNFGKQPPGRGIGLGCGTEKGSFVAACAEVEVSGDAIEVIRVSQVFECGAVHNPNNLKAQVEGALIQGLGGALFESIEFSEGQVKTDNFSSYRVPRLSDVPELDIVLLNRHDLPSVGGSETPIIAIAPAIANAIANACGTRSRTLPLRISS